VVVGAVLNEESAGRVVVEPLEVSAGGVVSQLGPDGGGMKIVGAIRLGSTSRTGAN